MFRLLAFSNCTDGWAYVQNVDTKRIDCYKHPYTHIAFCDVRPSQIRDELSREHFFAPEKGHRNWDEKSELFDHLKGQYDRTQAHLMRGDG